MTECTSNFCNEKLKAKTISQPHDSYIQDWLLCKICLIVEELFELLSLKFCLLVIEVLLNDQIPI